MIFINKADLLNSISTEIQYNTEKPLESYTKLLSLINNYEGIDINSNETERLLNELVTYTVLINAYQITNADERVKLLETLNSVPTINPVKHGQWLKNDEGDYHCSLCQAIVESDEQYRHYWKYCYHCGAKMDDEDKYAIK